LDYNAAGLVTGCLEYDDTGSLDVTDVYTYDASGWIQRREQQTGDPATAIVVDYQTDSSGRDIKETLNTLSGVALV
jgi:hypothetical protein